MYNFQQRYPFPSHNTLIKTHPDRILTDADYRFAYIHYCILALEYTVQVTFGITNNESPNKAFEEAYFQYIVGEAVQRALTMRLG